MAREAGESSRVAPKAGARGTNVAVCRCTEQQRRAILEEGERGWRNGQRPVYIEVKHEAGRSAGTEREGGRASTGKGGILEPGLALKYTPREIPGVN